MCDDVITPSSIKDAYIQLFGMQSHVLMAMDLPVSELVVVSRLRRHYNPIFYRA